jgi:hypothetical protein
LAFFNSLLHSSRSNEKLLKEDPMLARGTILPSVVVTIGCCLAALSALPALGEECVPVIKTGQVSCYDARGNSVSCVNTGQDGEHRPGMAWPSPRFIDAGDGTVRDALTALVWTKDAQQVKGAMTWVDALAACNDLDFAGHSDWRLPNVRELLSLVDYEAHDPALPQGHPFDNVQFIFYWSSTTYDASAINAWGVYLYNGYAFNYHKATKAYVWPVRRAKRPEEAAGR